LLAWQQEGCDACALQVLLYVSHAAHAAWGPAPGQTSAMVQGPVYSAVPVWRAW
jgi:hypothetical protein